MSLRLIPERPQSVAGVPRAIPSASGTSPMSPSPSQGPPRVPEPLRRVPTVSPCVPCVPRLNVSIECRRVSGLEPSTLDWAFELTKANMQTLYEQSEWGWKEREKREELRDERAWYLLAREPGHGPVAFSHFRFDVECGDEVLYCYEVQLESRVRRRGLGKFLLQILQLVANSTQMKKVMLTVFKHNHGALQFFREALHDRAPRAGGAGAQTEVRGGRHLPQRVRLLRGRFLLRDPEPQHQIRGPPPRGGPLRRLLPLSPPKNSPGPAWRDPRGG
uniref:N-alpha-acetyltransferase 40 n=1 Tax=Taeniopygia guttata TaxID=59729 RepID=A0A674H1J6_TAEGU